MKRLFLAFLLYPLLSFPQTQEIIFQEAYPTIDGQLNEPIWETLPIYGGFSNFYPSDEGKAHNPTEVRLFHNGQSLFISAVYHDSTAKSMVNSLKRNNHWETIIQSDAFGIVIDPLQKQQNGFYFTVNASGAQVDAIVETVGDGYSLNTSWNTIWKSRTSQQGKDKIFEIEIPLKALSFAHGQSEWGMQFFFNDVKMNQWTTFHPLGNNYFQFDLRMMAGFSIQNLPPKSSSRLTLVPSLTSSLTQDIAQSTEDFGLKPSLDLQYNLSSSLKLDATINSDFSQIDVDQQVTNLSRFEVNFPERRNFFLENSDLFANLGNSNINPFYSRRIGRGEDVLGGLKLSGNLAENTRIGLLSTQTRALASEAGSSPASRPSTNYAVLVAQQKLSSRFTVNGFLINRQLTSENSGLPDFNRVTGLNLNYRSSNNHWLGLGNYAKSFSDGIQGENQFSHAALYYNTRKVRLGASAEQIGQNYITDVGFTPRLYHYDAENDTTIRKSYTQLSAFARLFRFPEKSKVLNQHRYLNISNDTYLDEQGSVTESRTFLNNALWFKNSAIAYGNVYLAHVNLPYGFDLLGNGNPLAPGIYNFSSARVGFRSPLNRDLTYGANTQYGQYFSGHLFRNEFTLGYRIMPKAKFSLKYELNQLRMGDLGKRDFHLINFTSNVSFSTAINWTTYLQYNSQWDNFNINSRLQWEYRPLSYLYLVVTDNSDQRLRQKNWGVALKWNRRLDL